MFGRFPCVVEIGLGEDEGGLVLSGQVDGDFVDRGDFFAAGAVFKNVFGVVAWVWYQFVELVFHCVCSLLLLQIKKEGSQGKPSPLVGFFWFLIVLFPVVGISVAAFLEWYEFVANLVEDVAFGWGFDELEIVVVESALVKGPCPG